MKITKFQDTIVVVMLNEYYYYSLDIHSWYTIEPFDLERKCYWMKTSPEVPRLFLELYTKRDV